MPRKKNAKSASKKSTTKNQTTKSNISNATAALQKALQDAPAKIIAQLNKEIATAKQNEKRLQAALKKAQSAKSAAEKQFAAITSKHKAKPTAASKKQLAKQKQNFDKNSKTLAEITNQANQSKAQITHLTSQQAKYAELTKRIAQFDKEWEAKVRAAAAELAAKAREAAAKLAAKAREAAAKAEAKAAAKKAAAEAKKAAAERKKAAKSAKPAQNREETLTPYNTQEQTTVSTPEVETVE